MRNTKIVATLGPSSSSAETIEKLAFAGMDVARLNCAHGTWEMREKMIADVRCLAGRLRRPVGILVYLAGPKIRFGDIPNDKIHVQPGTLVVLALEPENSDELHLPIPEVFDICHKNSDILIGDGYVALKVISAEKKRLVAEAQTYGEIKSKQGVTVIEASPALPALTKKDMQDIENAVRLDADYIALSYVRSASDVMTLATLLHSMGNKIPIIAKIETREAVLDIDNIINSADGIMIARGDLGLQMDLAESPPLQKSIIRKTVTAGKPVITATQMLESMISNPRPTRAEVSDVANAVFDGTSAVMLSGETAAGNYPIEAVKMMANIIEKAEQNRNKDRSYQGFTDSSVANSTSAVARAAYELAHDLNVASIICATTSGFTARMVAKHRPSPPIIGVTDNEQTYRRLSLVWGVRSILIPKVNTTDAMVEEALNAAVENEYIRDGDQAVIIAGIPVGSAGNTNLILVKQYNENS